MITITVLLWPAVNVFFKLTQLLSFCSDSVSKTKRIFYLKFCAKHANEPLGYYCADCNKIVCASCFVESYKLQDGKDIATVDEEFRKNN